MALSGAVLTGFVVGHCIGNLQAFLGPEALNAYAAALQKLIGPLWVVRVVLLATIVIHIYNGLRLTLQNQAARPVAYASKAYNRASLASRTMHYTGIVVLLFLLYHLADFTLGVVEPEYKAMVDPVGRPDVYRMVVHEFGETGVAAVYVVSMLALGAHLYHGVSSMLLSLGLRHGKYDGLIACLGPMVASLVVIGNCAFPLAVFFGFIGPST